MAKKQGVSKTQAVLDYWKAHPKAKAAEIAEALAKQGITITVGHVGNIKSTLKRKRLARKAAGAKAATPEAQAAATAESTTEKITASGNIVALEHVKAVAQTVKAIGGFDRLNELLGVIKEVGGIKRFKDLLDAMAVTSGNVTKIPF